MSTLSIASVVVCAAIGLFSLAGAGPIPVCGARSPVVARISIPAAALSAQPTQLADDAERRLRRLGINFNPGRIERPYDPAGELC